MPTRQTALNADRVASADEPTWPALATVPLGLLLIVCLGWVEFALVGTAAIVWLYLVPIGVVSWLVGRSAGILMAVTASVVGISINLLVTDDQQALPLFGGTAIRLAGYLGAVYVVSRMKSAAGGHGFDANPDGLNGISTRQEFLRKARAELDRSARKRDPTTAIYLDIDNFKAVNQRLGYDAANAFLSRVAETIIQSVRGGYLLARLDGDDFAIILQATDAGAARETVERIRAALGLHTRQADWCITFTVGVVTFLRPAHSVEEVIRMARNLVCLLKQDRIDATGYQVVGESREE